MDMLFYGIALIAFLFGNTLLIMLGFMAGRAQGGGGAGIAELGSSVQQELKGVSLSLAALSERLVKLEIQIGQLRDQAGHQPLPLSREAEQKSFKVATKLALQGASVDEIVDLCGLARGEAELICMLHSSSQVSPQGVANETKMPQRSASKQSLESKYRFDDDAPDDDTESPPSQQPDQEDDDGATTVVKRR